MKKERVAVESMSERILETALSRFEAYGYASTSLRDIADELGLTKAALYYHFPAKSDMVKRLLMPVEEQLTSTFSHLTSDPHDLSSVRKVMEAYLQVYIDHQRVMRWLTNDVTAEIDRQSHVKGRRRLRDMILVPNASRAQVVRANAVVLLLHYPVWSRWTPSDKEVLLDAAISLLTMPIGAGVSLG